MKREWLGLLLVLLFVVSLSLFGCGPQNSGSPAPPAPDHPPAAVPLDQTQQQAQDTVHQTLDNPNAPLNDLIDSLGAAEQYGFADNLGVAQQWGYQETVESLLKKRIESLLMQELLDPSVCKKRAGEILKIAQELELSEVEKMADAKTEIGADLCGEVPIGAESTITFDMMNTIDEGEGTKYLVKQTSSGSINGKLQEYTLLGMRSEDSRSYIFTGDITWEYEEWYLNDCTLKISRSTGSETGKKLGSLTKYNDGSYGGSFSFPVKLQVIASPAGEGFLFNRVAESSPESVDEAGEAENMRNLIANMCADVQSETTEEDGSVNVNFDGDVNNHLATLPGADKRSKTVLTDDINKQGRGDDGDYSTKITYTLSLPE